MNKLPLDKSSELNNPYLRESEEVLQQLPISDEKIELKQSLDYAKSGAEGGVDVLTLTATWDALTQVRTPRIDKTKAALDIKPAFINRSAVGHPKVVKAGKAILQRIGWRDIDGWADELHQSYRDEANVSYTIANAVNVMAVGAEAIDGYKVRQIGQKTSTLASNSLIFRVFEERAYDLALQLGPRAKDPSAQIANVAYDALGYYLNSDRSFGNKWLAQKWTIAAHVLNEATTFYDNLANIKPSVELSTEFLCQYSGELMQEALKYREYGIKDSVGDIDNPNLPYREVQVLDFASIGATVGEDIHTPQYMLAHFTFTNGRFNSTSLTDTSHSAESENIKMVSFSADISAEDVTGDDFRILTVCLGKDGQLYNSRGFPLAEKAKLAGAENEYEQLRAEVITKFFDLSVPLEDYRVEGTKDRKDPVPPSSDDSTAWATLRIRRRRTLHENPVNEATDADEDRIIIFKEIPWQTRRLPAGYRATVRALENYREATGDPFTELPEGKTFVRRYTVGDPLLKRPGTRLKPRHSPSFASTKIPKNF